MIKNFELLNMARAFRRNLTWSRIPEYRNASLRDAVEMAADNIRQWNDEKRDERDAA